MISFRVERTDAGFAELDVTVTSPLGGELPLEIKRVAKEVRKLTSSAQERISIFVGEKAKGQRNFVFKRNCRFFWTFFANSSQQSWRFLRFFGL